MRLAHHTDPQCKPKAKCLHTQCHFAHSANGHRFPHWDLLPSCLCSRQPPALAKRPQAFCLNACQQWTLAELWGYQEGLWLTSACASLLAQRYNHCCYGCCQALHLLYRLFYLTHLLVFACTSYSADLTKQLCTARFHKTQLLTSWQRFLGAA